MRVPTWDKKQMEAIMDSMTLLCGGRAALKQEPHLCTIVNTKSPLQLYAAMTEVLFTFAEHGQPFAATNGAMAGSTAPLTLAGTIALFNAEILATIALTQMVNPGTPVFYGSQATTTNLKTGQMACGAPEGAICAKYVARLAKFYNLPCRGGGAITDAKITDAQAGMESLMLLLSSYENQIDLVIHAAGVLDSYLSVSYEKLILDFEIIRYVKRYCREFEINAATIPLELIQRIGHDGEYLTADHTCAYCRQEPLLPTVCSCGRVPNPQKQLAINTENEYLRMLKQYEPPRDRNKLAQIKGILTPAGADEYLLPTIEKM